jgi:hypothetical protein
MHVCRDAQWCRSYRRDLIKFLMVNIDMFPGGVFLDMASVVRPYPTSAAAPAAV